MVIKNNIETDKELLIFDIDGTLVRYNTIEDLIIEAYSYFNIDPTSYNVKKQGDGIARLLKDSVNKKVFSLDNLCRYWEREYYFLSRKEIKSMIDKMLELEKKYVEIFPNVASTLKKLQMKNYKMVCSTNWFENSQMIKLKEMKIDQYFNKIYTCEKNYAKPSYKHIDNIMKKENVSKDKCVIIGDSISDMKYYEYGIDTILIDYNKDKSILYDNATSIITNFKELDKILTKKCNNLGGTNYER